ncbi:MAG: hypothetical protein HUJ75_00990, partial [Parasporobacterium sp.]|nr:hypothetical protein [Parasporobacterium sp.]
GLLPIIISVVIGIMAGFGIYFTPKLMKLDYGRFRLISAFYAAYLIFVTALSVCIMITEIQKGPAPASIMFAAGMVLFLLSDLVLSQIYFGKDKNTPANIAINHGLYYAAQIVIAAGIMFM